MKSHWTHRSFLGLELLLPLQAVLFDFTLGCFFGLLQPPVLSLAGLGLRLTGRGYGDGASGGDSEAADSGLPQPNRPLGSVSLHLKLTLEYSCMSKLMY